MHCAHCSAQPLGRPGRVPRLLPHRPAHLRHVCPAATHCCTSFPNVLQSRRSECVSCCFNIHPTVIQLPFLTPAFCRPFLPDMQARRSASFATPSSSPPPASCRAWAAAPAASASTAAASTSGSSPAARATARTARAVSQGRRQSCRSAGLVAGVPALVQKGLLLCAQRARAGSVWACCLPGLLTTSHSSVCHAAW